MSAPRYHAYLLRLWQQRIREQRTWRIVLEDVHTGERRRLSTLGELVEFLQSRFEASPNQQPPSGPEGRPGDSGGNPDPAC